MRYKVGDRVVIKKDIDKSNWNKTMKDLCGTTNEIIQVVNETGSIYCYKINGDVWFAEFEIDHEATAKLKEDKAKTYNLIEVMNSEEGTRFKKIDSENVYYICGEHLFVEFSTGGRGSCVCTKEIVEAQFTLVQPKIKLSDDEKVILRNLDPEYKWIAVDKDCSVWLYDMKPRKDKSDFYNDGGGEHVDKFTFNHLFHQLTFENSPHLIADLIKE